MAVRITGSVNGGSQAVFLSNGGLNINGSLNMPGAYVYLYGNTLSSTSTAGITAYQATFAPTNDVPITLAAGGGSGASGFVVTANLLNSTNAQVVQIGNGGSAGITVQGNVNLSRASIGELYQYTGGIYEATGASLSLAPQSSMYVNAGSINTGSVNGGSASTFVSAGTLTVDGAIGSNTVVFDGSPVNYAPIAFVESFDGHAKPLFESSMMFFDIWQVGNCKAGISANEIYLDSGEILLFAKSSCVVKQHDCEMTIAKGAIVLLASHDGVISIKVLHDRKNNSVRVTLRSSKTQIGITSGKELIILPGTSISNEHPLPSDSVARRRVSTSLLRDHLILQSEFSFTSALKSSPVLRGVLQRSDKNEVKKQVFLTNACLDLVTRSHGGFSSIKAFPN